MNGLKRFIHNIIVIDIICYILVYHTCNLQAMEKQPKECAPVSMDSEDDLFVMFTSGVTGTAKGIIHSQAGYLLHVAVTHKV